MSNQLSTLGAVNYQGTNAVQPINIWYRKRNPLTSDVRYSVGDMWLNTLTKKAWILVSLAGTLASHGALIATWLRVTNSFIGGIQGNNNVKVKPDSFNNIDLKGDGSTIQIVGTPLSHTLTMSSLATNVIKTIQGNSGLPVSADSSNTIYLVGDGTTIDFVGNTDPDTHTLEAVLLNPLPFTITGNNSRPVGLSGSGTIYLEGDTTTINVVGDPDTHTLTMSLISSSNDQFLEGDTGGPITPTGGTIYLKGGAGFDVSGNLATHTLTVEQGDDLADLFDADIGQAVPVNNILEIGGATNIETTGTGNTLSVATDTVISGLVEVETEALNVTTAATMLIGGEGVLQSSSLGALSSTEGTDGQLLISSSTGVPVWSNITAGSNITIVNGSNSISVSRSGSGLSGFDFIGTTSSGSPTLAIPAGYRSIAIKMNWTRITVSPGSIVQVPITLSDNGGSSFYTSNYIAGVVAPTYRNTFPLTSTSTSALLGGIFFGGGSTNQAYLSFFVFITGIDASTVMSSGTGVTFTYGGFTPYFMRISGAYYGSLSGPVNAIRCTYNTQVYGFTY